MKWQHIHSDRDRCAPRLAGRISPSRPTEVFLANSAQGHEELILMICLTSQFCRMTAGKAASKSELAAAPHGTGRARQRNSSWKTGHRWRAPCPAARYVSGGVSRSTSQPKLKVLRRSPPKGWQIAQSHHQRRCQKAGHNRECVVQKPSGMDTSCDLTDTVGSKVKHLFQKLRQWTWTWTLQSDL